MGVGLPSQGYPLLYLARTLDVIDSTTLAAIAN